MAAAFAPLVWLRNVGAAMLNVVLSLGWVYALIPCFVGIGIVACAFAGAGVTFLRASSQREDNDTVLFFSEGREFELKVPSPIRYGLSSVLSNEAGRLVELTRFFPHLSLHEESQ